MATPNPILQMQTRAARDRVIDLLGIGETYPLQDVVVEESKRTVEFGKDSKFNINPGQKDVKYELYDGFFAKVEDVDVTKLVGTCDHGEGGETTIFGTTITGDKAFQILAAKIDRLERKVFLSDAAFIKVGLDTSLPAWIPTSPPTIDFLDPTSPSDSETAPRIADYESRVEVRVAHTQAQVFYSLIDPKENVISEQDVEGNDGEISLFTNKDKIKEDTNIGIAIKRTFKASEGRDDLFGELEAKLPLAVRANPNLAVSIDSHLVNPFRNDDQGYATFTIATGQQRVTYSAYGRELIDDDFELNPAEPSFDTNVLLVSVPDSLDVLKHDVRVHKPPRPNPWVVQEGYQARGRPMPGPGTDVTLAVGPFVEDSIVVIKAEKNHSDETLGLSGTSSVQLMDAVAVLVRPEPRELTLTLDETNRTLLVSGGQQGVFYHFRLPSDPPAEPPLPEIGLSAYFHRLDDRYRGVDHLRIEMDLVPVRDGPDGMPPPDPLLDVTLDPQAPAALDVMAVKARTRVGWSQSRTNTITILIQEP